jgi:hypothetical protein
LILEVFPIVCGGISQIDGVLSECYVVGESISTVSLDAPRHRGYGIMLDNETLWVTGGLDSFSTRLATTEFVSLNESKFGPDLPMKTYDHCMVKINEGTIMMTGGSSNSVFNSVFNYDIENQTWTSGPDMISPRRGHACGIQWTTLPQGLIGNSHRSVVIVVPDDIVTCV